MGLIFSGQDFMDYGVVVDSIQSWDKPVRDRTLVHVPGRNGDLILDNGCWNNIEITYTCHILDGWEVKFNDFVKMMYGISGYQELYDYNHPGVLRMAEFAGGIEPEIVFTTETGRFNITFNCKPQTYITGIPDTELDFTSADATGTFNNTYGMDAYPLLRITGANSGAHIEWSGGENNWSIFLAANAYDGIVIDCEAETCYAVDAFGVQIANANSIVTFVPGIDNTTYRDFPYFSPAIGLTVTAYHEDRDPDDMDVIIATYTGTVDITPRYTRI